MRSSHNAGLSEKEINDLIEQEDEAVFFRKEFYDNINLIVSKNELIDLNLE